MKIMHIIPSLITGGGEKFTVDLCNELSKKNEVILCTLYDCERDMFLPDTLSDKVKLVELGKGHGFDWRIIFKIYALVRKEKPEVINTHLRGLIYSWFAQSVFMVKSFHTVHNIAERESGNSVRCFYGALFTLFDISPISISNEVLLSVKRCYGDGNNICVENGVKKPSITSHAEVVRKEVFDYRITSETKIFLNIGRLCDQKNQLMLVGVFNRLIEEGADVILLVVGEDEKENEEYLNKLIELKDNERIHFLGLKDNVSDYLAEVDVFCLSSIYEGLPITLLEAMAMGSMVLCTPVGGIPDVVVHNKNGILAVDSSPNAFYDGVMQFLCMRDDLVREIKYAAKDGFEKKYNIELTSQKYMEQYVGL